MSIPIYHSLFKQERVRPRMLSGASSRQIIPGLTWLWTITFLATSSLTAAPIPGLIIPLHDVEVGTSSAGIVAEVLVKEGDAVTKGQPLVRLHDEVEKLEVERAAKVLEKAKFDHDAAQKLLAEKIGTREDALKKQIEHDLAKLQKQAAEIRLSQRTITAPIQGIVVKRDKEPGEAVLLNETVTQIVHMQQVYAQFYLEPDQARLLKPEDSISINLPSLPQPNEFKAKVDFMDPRMDAESGLYRVKLLLENPDLKLKAGMRAEWQR
ncbi:MAG: efflux RND transporter periplasmic adaptor subunit [Verrucomicrobia bacterium]|nr:efflux RND transporter periplasmic adaptor subunit [Verrucomicrobiota bacterium]